MVALQTDKFVFKRLDVIGHPDAEEDKAFLADCFVDTGELSVLRDCGDPRRLVLGRSGAGKTALLQKLTEAEERTIVIKPESLALSYISNSTILNFVSQLDVKLDIFFRLLWRHVFTVEILRAHFHLDSEAATVGFFKGLGNIFRDQRHNQALAYLQKWGSSFWEDTDYRIREVTTKLESDLSASIGTDKLPVSINIEGARKLTEEQRQEVAQRAQTVVNQVQIRELSDVINSLDYVLNDPQKRYFLVIDRLDENWVEDKVRYLLIRALIETARDFRSVRHAKIVAALRIDLIERVFKLTRDAGFQEEKYEGMYLPLTWSHDQLVSILDTRIRYLVRKRYNTSQVTHADLLPGTVGRQTAIDWLIDRTLLRPRDVIAMFNEAIGQAVNNPLITTGMLKNAEGRYSRGRLKSLADEWFADYPNLLTFVDILKNRRSFFPLADLDVATCENFCIDVVSNGFDRQDYLSTAASQVVDCALAVTDFRRALVEVFYRVGIVGLKLETYETVAWSIEGSRTVSTAEIDPETKIAIHACFWRTLGINPVSDVS
jgi:hypothetical protein